MHHDERLDIPALYPLIGYVAGLTFGPLLVNATAALTGAAAIAVLAASVRRPRVALMASLLATGLAMIGAARERAGAESAAMAGLVPDRFVTIRAPLDRGWRQNSELSHTLIASQFAVAAPAAFGVQRTLVITISFTPPPIANEAVVIAEGFLRCEPVVCYLSVKSPRLMHYRGSTRWWTPAGANRRMNDALNGLAALRPGKRRAVVLAQALVLGRSDQLPDDVRESYRRGGIYHLLVFSGMQIGLAAWLLSSLLRSLGAAGSADWALLGLSILAPFFAGNEPSVARASWMIGLYSVSRLIGRPTGIANLLFVSALIRLLAHPEELTDAGFALTYAATGGLILIGGSFASLVPPSRQGAGSWWRSGFRALLYGVGAELATLPLTLFFFHQYVAAGSVVTLLVSPLLSAMLGAGAIAAAIAPFSAVGAAPFLEPVAWLDRVCTWMSSLVGERLGLSGMAAAPSTTVVCLALLALLLVLPWLRRRGRVLAAIALLSLPVVASVQTTFFSTVNTPMLDVLDVGQGDALLLRTRAGNVLVDGGGRSDDTRWGRVHFLPMLLDRGVRSLDAVALTHPDPDHCGGLSAALEHLPVRELWILRDHLESPCGADLFSRAERQGTTVLFADRIARLERSGMTFDVVPARLRFKRSRWNNGSVVLRVHIGGRLVLLTGDIEKEAERLHADEAPAQLRADILKVPHHGSKTSSTAEFLAMVKPRIALVSCGRRNRFGHPAPEVVERLSRSAALVGRTDLSGAITIRFEEGAMFVERQFDTPRSGL